MGWGPFEFVRRAITLPQRYNSLSDVAKDPFGAAMNALPYVALASGMGWVKIPGLPAGFLKGTTLKGASGLLGNLGAWVSKNPAQAALLGVGLLQGMRAQSATNAAEGAVGDLQNLYARLLQQSLPLSSALNQARLQTLNQALAQPDQAIAQARRALDTQLQAINRAQAQSGLKTASQDRLRAQAVANFAAQAAALRNATPWQRLAFLMGAGPGYDVGALGGLNTLLQQRFALRSGQEGQLLQSLATMLPIILGEV